jgi:hypothetical protein
LNSSPVSDLVPESSELSTMTATKYSPKEVVLRLSLKHSSRPYWTSQRYQRPPTLMTNELFEKRGFEADAQPKPKPMLKSQTQTRQPLTLNLYTPSLTHVHLQFYILIFRIETPSSSLLLIAISSFSSPPIYPISPAPQDQWKGRTGATDYTNTEIWDGRNGRVGAMSHRSTLPVGGARVYQHVMWIARGNRRKKMKGEEVFFAPSLAA